ncbi:putative F-box domain-containing protein [Medicago truncatula]|nr:F-box/kelch-repeat protein At3g23880 [Medicago truncatula]RHN65301.1 putative F-box domain-containing protein [Medicago truncatula]
MALSCKGGDERTKAVYSPIGTLTSSPSLYALPLPTLPFELIEEILSRLPVKLLLQLRCSCKSWNSLISDPKFAKKHLSLSTTHNVHCITYSNKYIIIESYPLDTITATNIAQSYLPFSHSAYFLGSCDGILCLAAADDSNSIIVRLWNPSIRKDKELPLLQEPKKQKHVMRMYGFGYDPVGDNYKVVVFLRLIDSNISNFVDKYKVKVHTLGTSSWENISNFPLVFPLKKLGQFVSGTINWLASKDQSRSQCFVAALDLGSGSYQEVLLPDDGEVHAYPLVLTVLRDCLCIFSGDDVWVMKEYGNKESWTKLFTISYMQDPYRPSYDVFKAVYIFEDYLVRQVSQSFGQQKFIFYNRRNDTSRLFVSVDTPEVCIESLISPCF